MPAREDSASVRQRILDIALSMMAQRGVNGTSMRDLAGAVGLNVASLYHYFPSKRDLLLAVLGEQGRPDRLGERTPGLQIGDFGGLGTEDAPAPSGATTLVDLLDEMLSSMLDVQDFVRLMLGEVMRGEDIARSVGSELYATTQLSLQRWLERHPELVDEERAPGAARALRAFMVGLFFEHVAGVLDDDGDTRKAFHERAEEMVTTLSLRAPTSGGA